MGVVLFVLVTGKLPFGKAVIFDQYYRNFIKEDPDAFWKMLLPKTGQVSQEFIDLINKMLSYSPQSRPTIEEIKKHDWLQGDTATYEEIVTEFNKRDPVVKKMRKIEADEKDASKKLNKDGKYKTEDEGTFINFDIERELLPYVETKNACKVVCNAENANHVLGKVFNFFENMERKHDIKVSSKGYSLVVNFLASEEEIDEFPEAEFYTLKLEITIKSSNDYFIIEFLKLQGEKTEYYDVFEEFVENSNPIAEEL